MTSKIDSLPAPRARLAAVLRAAKEVVSVDIAARTLARGNLALGLDEN